MGNDCSKCWSEQCTVAERYRKRHLNTSSWWQSCAVQAKMALMASHVKPHRGRQSGRMTASAKKVTTALRFASSDPSGVT